MIFVLTNCKRTQPLGCFWKSNHLLLEIASKCGDIAALYKKLTEQYGLPYYTRVDVPTDEAAKHSAPFMEMLAHTWMLSEWRRRTGKGASGLHSSL